MKHLPCVQGSEHDEKMASIPDQVKLVGRPVYLALVDVACGELRLVFCATLIALALSAVN